MQGIIVFASVMATLGLQILIESGRQIIAKVITYQLLLSNICAHFSVIGFIICSRVLNFRVSFFFLQAKPEVDPIRVNWMIGIMVSVTVVKFILMVYCRRFKNEIVRAYAQDHLFDVITNSVGLAAAVLAIKLQWWIDPTGAIIVSL
jgi:divalent metal cation (Fe/Co/Zn/Cd) transporter